MRAPLDDPELGEVFREEMTRHAETLRTQASEDLWRAALHSMRGAAAMMGLDDLAREVGATEEALRARRSDDARRRLGALERALVEVGVPAHGLGALEPRMSSSPLSSPPSTAEWEELLGYFLADAQERLSTLREIFAAAQALESRPLRGGALDDALRVLHALKGAAGVAGAHGVARAVHALEGAAQSLAARASHDPREYASLERARAQIAVALGAPDGGDAAADAVVEGLRGAGLLRARDVHPGASGASSVRSPVDASRADEHVRVATRTVAQLVETLGEVAFVRARADLEADALTELSREVGRGAQALEEAMRRIGPARPWGVPAEVIASLRSVSTQLRDTCTAMDGASSRTRRQGDALGRANERAQELLRGVGQVTAGWIFDRVASAAHAPPGSDAQVRVLRSGDDTPVERALAEPLVDVLSQLVRNAVAHGVERPSLRLARNKPAHGALRLEAVSEGETLRFCVEDDGEGVDLDAVRARTTREGHPPPGGSWTDEALLEALFLPGVSTRPWASADAGRGVGLDLVRASVRRLGGEVRASTRRGEGTRFDVTLASRPLAQRLLPVRMQRRDAMVPLSSVVRVDRAASVAQRVESLSALLGDASGGERAALCLRGISGERWVSVPELGLPLELVVRALPESLRGGLWRGAAIDATGRVVLVLEPEQLPRG